MPPFPRSLLPPLASALLSLACGGGAGRTDTAASAAAVLPGSLQLAFATPAGQVPAIHTSLVLQSGTPLEVPFMAYLTVPAAGAAGPVTLAVENRPPDLEVAVDGGTGDRFSLALNAPHRLTLVDRGTPGAGTLVFRLRASIQGQDRLLPVVVTRGAAPFAILPPGTVAVTVAPGQALTFPLHLWHADTYYASQDGAYPTYQGVTFLGCTGSLPPGLAVSFPDGPNPCDRSAAALRITADPGVAPGAYPLGLTAVRVAGATVAAAPVSLTVTVPGPADPPALWIQDVAWGQGVVAPDLRLVGDKPALLKVVVLADRPGLPAPAGIARILAPDGGIRAVLPLASPGQVPMAAAEGDLPGPGVPASAYTVTLPAAEVQPGLRVEVQVGDLRPLTLEPAVATALDLDLTAVPVVCQGVAPDLPGDADLTGALLAYWPLRTVRLAHRAPYVTTTTWPPPSSPGNPAAWAQLLAEMAALRILDGSTANYYGFVNPGFTTPPGWAITGLSSLGDGVSVGIDRAAARMFRNPDPDRNLAVMVLVHEEGHAFNLAHAPAGGAAGPQLEYPYYGGSIGSWGYDPAAQAARDPVATSDIMGYGSRPHWVSDWNYRSAMGFLEQREAPAPTAQARLAAAGPEQWLVSGWVEPDGQVRMLPLVRAACRPAPPGPGDLELRLATPAGVARASFAAAPAPDLPAGWRTFCFTVPAGGDATGLEVRAEGKAVFQLRPARIGALAAPGPAAAPVLREQAGVLHLRWDARTHPYAHLFHEGTVRTTLALHLAGGSADLPLDGLEPGGAFALHLTGGLEPLVVRVPR